MGLMKVGENDVYNSTMANETSNFYIRCNCNYIICNISVVNKLVTSAVIIGMITDLIIKEIISVREFSL